ncbi:unnamed protein product [Rhizophagus irregularis]|nr:unnamed protein product [Rhizophagus irregularis]CAB4437656.1 unnamed protein product [Rhizophagus irregularis]
MLGFHDSYMIQQMLNNVDFHPFTICLYNITIIIASIPDNNYCMKGLQLVLCIKQSVIWQKIKGGLFSISIFQDGEMVKQFKDITAASSVWNQTQLLRNLLLLNKKLIHGVYDDINHETNMHELWEWRVMLEAIGCKNITPFERDVSDMEFWNRAKEPKGDIKTISNLFSNGILNTMLNSTIRNDEFENYKDTANVFWYYSLCESLDANPNGSNGKMQKFHL